MAEWSRGRYAPALLLVAAVFVRAAIGRPVEVGTWAMFPSLRRGDVVWVWRGEGIDPGDVALVRWARGESPAFSRLIATGRAGIRTDASATLPGAIPVADVPAPGCAEGEASAVQESRAGASWIALPGGAAVDQVIPDGRHLLLADHRSAGGDSRQWGTIGANDVLGRAGFVLWSWDPCSGGLSFARAGLLVR